MQKGGKEYKRLVGAFERIFGATIFFGTDSMVGKAKLVQRSRFNFLQEAQIWYDRNLDQHPLSDEFENVIVVLSDDLYRETTSHPIPADLEAVKVLAGAPAAPDLFMWMSYWCFVASGQESIPLFGERGLASQLGAVEYSRPRRFCQKLEQWLKMIRLLWPDCPAQINRTGLCASRQPGVGSQPGGRPLERQKGSAHKELTQTSSKEIEESCRERIWSFSLEIRIRGRANSLHRETCRGLEDAIRIGEKWFRAFRAKNPRFVQDSKRRRIFILLDPESRSLLRL